VLSWIVGLLTAGILGSALWMSSAGHGVPANASASGSFEKGSPLGNLEAWGKKMEAAGKQMESAQKAGDSKATGQAMGNMLGAVLGGTGGAAEALAPDRLKAFVPGTLNNLPRTEVTAERNAAMGIQVASARGSYSDAQGHELRLQITDAGGASGFMALAGWANVESETERSDGYERTRKENGRMVHEQWQRHSDGGGNGKYSTTLADRFMVEVSGDARSIDELKSALASVNLAGLEALKNEGVKQN
jgi:hypothetical protein